MSTHVRSSIYSKTGFLKSGTGSPAFQKTCIPDIVVIIFCFADYIPGPEVIKLFPCSTQLSTRFILLVNVKMPTIGGTKFTLLINVKMPTIVGILTFISMKNTTSERLKKRNFFICRYLIFYEQLKFLAQLS